jgi:hypothetical protein
MPRRWLIAGAVLLLSAEPGWAFEVFHSKSNAAADRVPGVVPNGGGVTNLNVWIDTKEGGVANPGNPALACSGPGSTGDYACAWDLQFTTTGNIVITGFTPQQGGDYIVMHQASPTSLRMNGGKPSGPVYELDELPIGTLHVQATGPSGQVLMNVGSSVDTELNLVPIPGTPTLLASTCGSGTLDSDCDALALPGDNCPFHATSNTADTDTDGRGDECECTDQNGDGRNTVSDIVAINIAIFNPSQATVLCDGNGDGQCNVNDIIAANTEIFSPTSTSICSRQPVPGP